jgi:hypothetical protein
MISGFSGWPCWSGSEHEYRYDVWFGDWKSPLSGYVRELYPLYLKQAAAIKGKTLMQYKRTE